MRGRLEGILAVLLLAAVATVTEAQDVDIPDQNLRAVIEAALGKQSGDPITVAEMEGLTELSARNRRIEDLTGLEHATGLTQLYLSYNGIADMAPLADLASLVTLSLRGNRISDATPLADLAALETLDLRGNRISDATPLADLATLRWLDLSDNGIADMAPLADLASLETLLLDNNRISDVPPLAGPATLRWLDLSDNGIADMAPLADLASLETLLLDNNRISDTTPLADLATLRWLDLSDNGIADLAPLADLASLETLVLDNNRISDLTPLFNLPVLRGLGLANTGITDLTPLSGLAALTWLGLSDNGIADLAPLADLASLESLDLDNNRISDVTPLAGLATLTRLNLSDNGIADLSPLADLATLRWLYLSDTGIADLAPLADLASLITLSLDNNRISDVTPLAGLASLRWLYLSDNGIVDLAPLSNLPGLNSLGLSNTGITDLAPLSGLAALRWLGLSDNLIVDLSPLTGMNRLSGLDLSNTRMTDLSAVERLPSLRDLNAAVNEIVDIGPAARMRSLQTLHLGGNAVADIGPLVSEPASLHHLSLWANPIEANSRDVDIAAMRERGVRVTGGGWRVPFFPAPGGFRQGFVRVVSSVFGIPLTGTERAWIYASGREGSPSRLWLGARRARHFNSDDLVSGNPGKGLRKTPDSETRDSLDVYASADLDVLSYIRTSDGFVTSMHDTASWQPADERLDDLRGRTAPASGHAAGGHFVPIFNPASNSNQRSRLRLVNPSGDDVDVAVYAVDDQGAAAGPVRFSLAAHSTRTLDATELESGTADSTGSLGDGTGKWRLVVSADAEIHVMNLMSSPTGPPHQSVDRVRRRPRRADVPSGVASDAAGLRAGGEPRRHGRHGADPGIRRRGRVVRSRRPAVARWPHRAFQLRRLGVRQHGKRARRRRRHRRRAVAAGVRERIGPRVIRLCAHVGRVPDEHARSCRAGHVRRRGGQGPNGRGTKRAYLLVPRLPGRTTRSVLQSGEQHAPGQLASARQPGRVGRGGHRLRRRRRRRGARPGNAVAVGGNRADPYVPSARIGRGR